MEAIQTINLGQDKLSKLLIKFAIPCVMGLLISALYNIVDQIFIGNSELGYLGNAATGVSFPIICIANAFAWCVGDGAASYLSICAGRRDTDSAHKCVGTGITVTFIISVVLMAICLIFCRPLMLLFGASDLSIDLAVDYFTLIAIFFPFYLLLNVMNSMIRADGSPTYAMIAMLAGAIINVILDQIFIFVLKWGIKGAAWATAIGQVASFVLCAVYFLKPKNFKLTLKSFIPDLKILKHTVILGGATFITQISIVVVSLVCNMSLAKYGEMSIYGKDIPISVFSIQTKVYTLVCNIVTGIVLGAQPIFGYNYGAKRLDRVKKLYKMVLTSTIVIGVIATAIFQFCPEIVINLFGASDEIYMEFALKTFKIYLMLMAITCLVKMTAVFFQSIGKSVRAILASIVRDVLCFSVIAIILPIILEKNNPGTGINGILFAAPIADFVALIMILFLTIPFFKNIDEEGYDSGREEIPSVEDTIIKPSKPGVIITISREHGTLGKQIGRKLSLELNIPFYYKELTALAAKESGLDKEFISDVNENLPNYLYDLYLSTNVFKQAMFAQESIIRKIADRGSCVIIGRAADYVLKDYPNVIKVFIHAPKEYRVNNLMKVYGDSLDEANYHIKRSDEARASYYYNITSQKWGNPNNYDILIDASIGIEKSVELICKYLNENFIECGNLKNTKE